jgi:hypothetical protein
VPKLARQSTKLNSTHTTQLSPGASRLMLVGAALWPSKTTN